MGTQTETPEVSTRTDMDGMAKRCFERGSLNRSGVAHFEGFATSWIGWSMVELCSGGKDG